MQELLFARLSPLLVLKLLPKEAFALEDGAMDAESGAPVAEGRQLLLLLSVNKAYRASGRFEPP